MQITKSSFLLHLHCSTNFWFQQHKPEVLTQKPLSDFEQQIIDQGIEVESYARNLFPNGHLITTYGAEAIADTRAAILEGATTLFQATFAGDDLYAMCDIIQWNEKLQAWDIYEVKGTTSKQKKKEAHYWDVAFQREALERAGEKVGKLFLVELNKEYIKSGAIVVKDLLVVSDITEEIDTMRIEIQTEIGKAKETLATTEQPRDCECLYRSAANQCSTFDYLYPNMPEYSIYHIARIGSSLKKLRIMVDADIFDIEQVPDEIELSENQQNQVFVHNLNMEIFKKEEIENEFKNLVYPLYFLDYETIPTAIPLYDGCRPFQQVPFQFSVHIQDTPNAKLRHSEYLHLEKSNPIPNLAKQLRGAIGDQGSVIVWNKSFEGKCNSDMANQVPALSDFLLGINNRLYDLMDIFSKQCYVRKEFRGKTSIKNILPVLVPELSYKGLNIQDGGAATSTYKKLISGEVPDEIQRLVMKDLLKYCKMDTLAMVGIFWHVEAKVSIDK